MTNSVKKILRIKDMDIEIKTTLSADEERRFTDFILSYIVNIVSIAPELNQGLINWAIRTATILLYTNFTLENAYGLYEEGGIAKFTELLYGTPLYAMLAGSPEHPVHFDGKAYTEPAIDIEQFDTILKSVSTTLNRSFELLNKFQES